MHPRAPLLEFFESEFEMPPDTPVEIRRKDGSLQSEETVEDVMRRLPTLPGAGLEQDLLPLTAIYGATKLGDDLQQAGITDKGVPILQFARHLRNACAHGNRWHFRGNEPRYPAELRGCPLDASLHGSKALYGWLGPGDYLDFLDDLAGHLRSLC